ncbi:hypothetical protein FO519_003395 [Halicephalobus sp. NKZ332]|nr:hypothetical protein FO519_003395 [Halicephalobus sp. NKZ332]
MDVPDWLINTLPGIGIVGILTSICYLYVMHVQSKDAYNIFFAIGMTYAGFHGIIIAAKKDLESHVRPITCISEAIHITIWSYCDIANILILVLLTVDQLISVIWSKIHSDVSSHYFKTPVLFLIFALSFGIIIPTWHFSISVADNTTILVPQTCHMADIIYPWLYNYELEGRKWIPFICLGGLCLTSFILLIFQIQYNWEYKWTDSNTNAQQMYFFTLLRCLLTICAIHIPIILEASVSEQFPEQTASQRINKTEYLIRFSQSIAYEIIQPGLSIAFLPKYYNGLKVFFNKYTHNTKRNWESVDDPPVNKHLDSSDPDGGKHRSNSAGIYVVGISKNPLSYDADGQAQVEVVDATSYSRSDLSMTPTIVDGSSCLICEGPANGIHFKALSCAACNAFFRRSVAENRKYICREEGNCEINYKQRCLCRACRLKKCLKVGMDPSAVQPQRDAIGSKRKIVNEKKKSKGAKKTAVDPSVAEEENSSRKTPGTPEVPSVSSFPYDPSQSVVYQYSNSPSTETESKEYEEGAVIIECGNLIEEVLCSYQQLLERRRLLYCPRTLRDLLSGTVPTFRKESGYFMKDQFNAEVANTVEFLRSIQPFVIFDIDNQLALVRNFCLPMTIIEKYYMTYRQEGHKTNRIYHQNYCYRDLNEDLSQISEDDVSICALGMKQPIGKDNIHNSITRKTILEINIPYMKKAINDICLPMAAIGMTDVEVVGLMLIMLFDPNAPNLTEQAKKIVKAVRDRVYEDWFSIYAHNGIENGAEKVGNVILITSAIQEFAKLIPENFHFVRVFGIYDYDELLNDVFLRQ